MNRRKISGGIFLFLFIVIFTVDCAGPMNFRRGQKAAKTKRWDAAVEYYSKAVKAAPDNLTYQMHYRRALISASQEHYAKGHNFLEQSKGNKQLLEAAVSEFQKALSYDPTNQIAAAELENAINKLKEIQEKEREEKSALVKMKEEAEKKYPLVRILGPSEKTPIDLKFMEESVKNIITTLAKVAGINVIFDKDIRDDKFSIEFHNVTFRQALDQILAANMLFYKIIDENTILIAPENPQKRRQYDEQVVKTFYLSNAELNDVVNMIRNVIQVQRIATNTQLNAITIKDTPDRIAIAQKIIEANDKARAEILLDVEILEVNKTVAKRYGIDITPPYEITQSLDTGEGAGVLRGNQLTHLDAADWVFTIPSITYRLLRTDSHTKVLAKPQIRASEGQQVQVRLGNRIPIPITTFTGIGTVQPTPQPGLVAPITNYQQQDVGINIDVTPRVHHNREVTLQLRFELTSIAAQGRTINEPPTIGNRTVNTTIRLMDGETNLLAGLLREDERRSLRGIPGIEKIPLLRSLFASNDQNIEQTDVIFTITPHIIRMPNITEEDLQPLWVGTEDQPKLKEAPPINIFEKPQEKEEEVPEKKAPEEVKKTIPPEKIKKEVAPEKPKEEVVKPEKKPEAVPEEKIKSKQEQQKITEKPKEEEKKVSLIAGRIVVPANAKVGEDFLVGIFLEDVRDITLANISLFFSSNIIEMQEVKQGELLLTSYTSSLSSSIDLSKQIITIQITTDNELAGLNGSGVICYISFKANEAGTLQFSIANSQFTDKYNNIFGGEITPAALEILPKENP